MLAVAALVATAPPGSGATVYSARDAALRREVGRLMTDPSVTASTAHVGVVVADASTRTPVYVRYASAFDEVRYNPYWSTSYASSYYAAQVSALTLAPDTDYDAGTVIVTATPATSTTGSPRLTVTPASAASHV